MGANKDHNVLNERNHQRGPEGTFGAISGWHCGAQGSSFELHAALGIFFLMLSRSLGFML